jgi:hypothetical protein
MIRGSLDRLHFGDLLQWFQMGGISGRLTLKDRRGERRLDFNEGKVCFVSSTVAEERLASWIAARELVPIQELRRLLAISMLRRALFTDLLIAHGAIDAASLQCALTDLAEVITSRLLVSPEVRFDFNPTHPVLDVLGLSLNVQPSRLLMEAARRSDEFGLPGEDVSEHELPLTGEAFESLFWELVRDGITADESVSGDELSNLHDQVRDIVGAIAQWLAASPGLVPLPRRQVARIGRTTADGEPVGLFGLPHAAWNQMVFARSVRLGRTEEPLTLSALEQSASQHEVWPDIAAATFLRRPDLQKLDVFIQQVVTAWSKTSAAAASHLGVDEGTAALAVHLVSVPIDLVLWVLATLPVPHQNLRKALLDRLPRRVGSRLARLADFPQAFRDVLDPRRPTPLGVCLHLGRAQVPVIGPRPRTIPDNDNCLLQVASASTLASATDAAREAGEDCRREMRSTAGQEV